MCQTELAYPLAVTTFGKQQCQEIMWLILNEGLPKAGGICSMLCTIVHGPLHYAGLNIPNLCMEHFVGHLRMLQQYGDQPAH